MDGARWREGGREGGREGRSSLNKAGTDGEITRSAWCW